MSNLTYSNSSAQVWPTRKSAVRQFFEDQLVTSGSGGITRKHISAAGHGVRAGGESLLVGGILGAAHAKLRGGLDVKGVPIDAVGGVMGLVAGTFAAEEEIGRDLANAGAACLAVFAFRKTQDLVAEIELKKSGAVAGGGASTGQVKISKAQFGGEGDSLLGSLFGRSRRPGIIGAANGQSPNFGEDPVVAAARNL